MDGKSLAQKAWGSSPTGWTAAREFEPGTKEFFEKAMAARDGHECPWLPDVVPFQRMRGKKVLEVGFGPGYDAYTFMKNGADYHGIDITPENVERTKKHLGFYGFAPKVQQGDAEHLPYPDETFDVVFSFGVLHHVPDIDQAMSEAFRVIRPGGEAYIILYNKNSLFYRVTLGLWRHVILGGWRHMSLEDRLRGIEANEANVKPLVRVYTRSQCKAMMQKAGFSEVRATVRKLTWEDLPRFPAIWRAYRYIPKRLLLGLGRVMGWYVIANGEKRR